MRWLIFILLCNLVTGFIMNAKTGDGDYVIPGVEYMHPTEDIGNITDYEDKFNATELAESMKPPTDALGYLVYTVTTFVTTFNFFGAITWLVDGFPQLIEYWCSFIPSYPGIGIVQSFGYILRGVSVFMLATLLLEIFRGVAILP